MTTPEGEPELTQGEEDDVRAVLMAEELVKDPEPLMSLEEAFPLDDEDRD